MAISGIRSPFGSAVDTLSPAHAATLAVTITEPVTVLNIATHASVAVTLNLTLATTPPDGATLLVNFPVGATLRQLTPGTNMGGTVTTLATASKAYNWLFMFNTDKFYPVSAPVQIN